jgi:hypothetical protein
MELRGCRNIVFVVLACLAATTCWAREKTSRPKVLGIAFARVRVSKPEGDSFYGGVLKLPRLDVGSCISFEGQCYFVNLYQRIELVKLEDPKDSNLLAAVGLYASDVKAIHAYLISRGYEPGQIISDRHGTTYFEIRDPEKLASSSYRNPKALRIDQRRSTDRERDHSRGMGGEGPGGDGQVLQGCVGISRVLAGRDEGRGDELGGHASAGWNRLD